MAVLWAFLVRDLRIAASYRLQLFVQVTGVLTLAFTFFFLALMLHGVEHRIPALHRYGGGYFGFALVGLATSSLLDAALRAFSNGLREAQLTGTFEAMLATRAPVGLIVAGSGLYALLFTLARALGFVGVGVLLFGLDVRPEGLPAAALVLALTLGVTLALGLFAAGFVVRFQQGDPLSAGLAGLSWLLSGVIYPKEILPAEVQALASYLPMTHSLEAMRLALLGGADPASLGPAVAYLGTIAAAGLPLGALWFARCLAAARRSGTLAQY